MSTRESHPEHAAARLIVDKLAKAAGMPSGQVLIQHLDSLKADSPALAAIGKALLASVPTAGPTPDDAHPPGPKTKPAAGTVGAEVV